MRGINHEGRPDVKIFPLNGEFTVGVANTQLILDSFSTDLNAWRKLSKILPGTINPLAKRLPSCTTIYNKVFFSGTKALGTEQFLQPVTYIRSCPLQIDYGFFSDYDRLLICEVKAGGSTYVNNDALYDQLKATTEELSKQPELCAEVKTFAERVEAHIEAYLKTNNHLFLYEAAELVDDFRELVHSKEKAIASNILYLVKKKFKLFKRDLRRGYRSLICFLFKNMDANTDHSRALFSTKQLLLLTIKQYFNHEYSFRSNCVSTIFNPVRYVYNQCRETTIA